MHSAIPWCLKLKKGYYFNWAFISTVMGSLRTSHHSRLYSRCYCTGHRFSVIITFYIVAFGISDFTYNFIFYTIALWETRLTYEFIFHHHAYRKSLYLQSQLLNFVVLILFFKRSLLMGWGKNSLRHISTPRWDRNKIPSAILPIFDDCNSNWTIDETVWCDRKWKIQDGGL